MLIRLMIITIDLVALSAMLATTTLWRPLEQRTKTVFLVAGVILLGYAVSKAIYTFTDVTAIGAFDVTFGGTGLLVAMVGLLGLYPRLRDGAPRLSFAGVAATVIGAVGTLAVLGWVASATLLREGYPAIPEEAPAWTVAALFIVFITLALGFLLFGATSLRTDVFSQTIGRLLVVPGLAWIGLIVSNLFLPPGQYLGLLAYVPISLALLAIGYCLPTGVVQTDQMGSAPDSIT
jgi:hypothetical protein